MKTLIIGFSRPKKETLPSFIIRKTENTKFSHVYTKMYEPKVGDWLVFEAAGLKTRCWTDTDFSTKNIKIKEVILKVSDKQEQALFKKVYKNLNKDYGIKQLLGLGIVRLHALVGKKIQNPYRDGDKTYICSEYVGELLVELDYKINNLDELTPKDIYELLNGQTS
jgi:hypothetical protein